MDEMLWWLAWSALLVGCVFPAAVCFWLLRRLRVREIQLARASVRRHEIYQDLQNWRRAYKTLIQRQAEWLPAPKEMDEAFREAERMADLRIMRQAGRVTRARSDAGPPAKVSRLRVSRKPQNPV